MKITTLLLSGAVAMMALAGPAAQAKDWKTVTITLEGAYAPWELDECRRHSRRLRAELAKVLCERAKVECKLVASDWDGMIPALNAGKFDIIMDALSITDERKQVIDFTVPYAATPAAFAVAKDSPLANATGTGSTITMTVGQTGVKEIDALKAAFKGKTIGIQAATVYAKFVYDNFADVATIREYKTGADRDLDLQNAASISASTMPSISQPPSMRPTARSASPARRLPARSGASAKASASARPIPTCAICSAPPSSRLWPTARSRRCR